eukprot:3848644-Rhodomonas_salina.4
MRQRLSANGVFGAVKLDLLQTGRQLEQLQVFVGSGPPADTTCAHHALFQYLASSSARLDSYRFSNLSFQPSLSPSGSQPAC